MFLTKRRLYSIFATLFVLSSCDCYRTVSGTVLDAENHLPMSGVRVEAADDRSLYTLTDSSGFFELSRVSGGFNCPKLKVQITVSGYSAAELDEYYSTDTIYLVPDARQ